MQIFKRLYNWILSWAESPYGVPALGLLAFAEASFFPVPPDVLLMAMALARPSCAYKYALIAAVGSVLGGILGYYIGWGFWDMSQGYFYHYVPGFDGQKFDYVGHLFGEYGFWTVFAAGFTPIPYKLFTIAAGVFKINLPVFILASIVSRSLRFFLVAALFFFFGKQAREYIDKYFNLITYSVLGLIVLVVILYQSLR